MARSASCGSSNRSATICVAAARTAATYAEYMGHVNVLIACCGHLGLKDEARRLIEFRRASLGYDFSVSAARARLAAFAHCDVFLEGLSKAGVPE